MKFGAMALFREAAGHMIQASTAFFEMGSDTLNSSTGTSSVIPSGGVGKREAVHEAWNSWGVPSWTEKAIVNELELESLRSLELMATQV